MWPRLSNLVATARKASILLIARSMVVRFL
jgi:hypothetical protein